MMSTKTLHICQIHTAHLQRKYEHIWQSQERKSAAQWPSHGCLCGTLFHFAFLSWKQCLFPSLGHGEAFLTSVSAQLNWPWLHNTEHTARERKNRPQAQTPHWIVLLDSCRLHAHTHAHTHAKTLQLIWNKCMLQDMPLSCAGKIKFLS